MATPIACPQSCGRTRWAPPLLRSLERQLNVAGLHDEFGHRLGPLLAHAGVTARRDFAHHFLPERYAITFGDFRAEHGRVHVGAESPLGVIEDRVLIALGLLGAGLLNGVLPFGARHVPIEPSPMMVMAG